MCEWNPRSPTTTPQVRTAKLRSHPKHTRNWHKHRRDSPPNLTQSSSDVISYSREIDQETASGRGALDGESAAARQAGARVHLSVAGRECVRLEVDTHGYHAGEFHKLDRFELQHARNTVSTTGGQPAAISDPGWPATHCPVTCFLFSLFCSIPGFVLVWFKSPIPRSGKLVLVLFGFVV